MKKYFLVFVVTLSTICLGQTDKYKNYFGLRYSGEGERHLVNYMYMLGYAGYAFDPTDITDWMVKRDAGINFLSTFGIRMSPSDFFMFDIDISSDKYSYKHEGSMEETGLSLFLIEPRIGLRRIIKLADEVQPYYDLFISKSIAFANVESPGMPSTIKDMIVESLEDMNSEWGLGAGFGCEYLLADQLSLFLDVELIYKFVTGNSYTAYSTYDSSTGQYILAYTKREESQSHIFSRASIGFNIYF